MINFCGNCTKLKLDIEVGDCNLVTIKYRCSVNENPKGETTLFVNNNVPIGVNNLAKFTIPSVVNGVDFTSALLLSVPELYINDCLKYEKDKRQFIEFNRGCDGKYCIKCKDLNAKLYHESFDKSYGSIIRFESSCDKVQNMYLMMSINSNIVARIPEEKAIELIDDYNRRKELESKELKESVKKQSIWDRFTKSICKRNYK